eukprot:scaffold9953_cov32-Tisochrysis_lutea.AAC.3
MLKYASVVEVRIHAKHRFARLKVGRPKLAFPSNASRQYMPSVRRMGADSGVLISCCNFANVHAAQRLDNSRNQLIRGVAVAELAVCTITKRCHEVFLYLNRYVPLVLGRRDRESRRCPRFVRGSKRIRASRGRVK